MSLVCLQDERATGEKRDVFDVIAECTSRENANLKKKIQRQQLSERDYAYDRGRPIVPTPDDEFQAAVQDLIWSKKPHYFGTVNFNYPNDIARQKKQKYRYQRPRQDSLKNLDAVLNSKIVKRRANRLPEHMKISLVSFDEFTTTENLHWHFLLWIPDQNRFTNSGLTAEQIDLEIRRIITEVLEHFFPRASVDVQSIYSKGAVTYSTKCVKRSSDIDWNYWRRQSPEHDAVRLNTGAEFPAGDHDANANNSIARLRHPVEGSSRVAPATGIAESATEVGRRQTIAIDDSTSTVAVVEHSRDSDSTWRINFRGYSYRTLIARIAVMAREWFRMPLTDA